jgi:hypothetical protein
VEIAWLKCFEMLSEGVVHIGECVENGSNPRPQFGIFVRKHRVIALTIQHCRAPGQTCDGRTVSLRNYRAVKIGRPEPIDLTHLDTLGRRHNDLEDPEWGAPWRRGTGLRVWEGIAESILSTLTAEDAEKVGGFANKGNDRSRQRGQGDEDVYRGCSVRSGTVATR